MWSDVQLNRISVTTVWGKVEAEIQRGKQCSCPGKKSEIFFGKIDVAEMKTDLLGGLAHLDMRD